MSERIQKALATAGIASRREVERLIGAGEITVNGRPATIGQSVKPGDQIRVSGRPVSLADSPEPPRVLLYKKRVGEIVTRDDPEGRRTVFRKLPALKHGRWIAVGRLDLNTSGLLLFTNDGELARRLTHPSFEIPRVYAVRVLGTVDAAVIQRLTSGVELEDGVGRFVSMGPGENEDGEGANQWFRVVVREGRNRFVRRMIESQDLQVSRLIRTAYGPLELGRGIKSATAREATEQELLALLDVVGMQAAVAPKPVRRRSTVRDGDTAPAKPPGSFVRAAPMAKGGPRNRAQERRQRELEDDFEEQHGRRGKGGGRDVGVARVGTKAAPAAPPSGRRARSTADGKRSGTDRDKARAPGRDGERAPRGAAAVKANRRDAAKPARSPDVAPRRPAAKPAARSSSKRPTRTRR